MPVGPEDEFEPDWGVGPGTTGLELPSIAAEPVDHGTVDVRHRLMHGARLGIDVGGVLMRICDVRNPERCGFRPGAEDWVAMLIRSLGDTNAHIINRVSGSGTEWRLREFLRSSGFMARTGFLADNVHCCRTRSGMRCKSMVFQTSQPHPLSGRSCGVPYGHQHPDARVGNAFSLMPTMYACGRVAHPKRTPPHGIVTIADLGKVGC